MSPSPSSDLPAEHAEHAALKASAISAAQQSDNIAHALAGAGGGLLSMTLTYPLITLSTRAQVESKRAQSSIYDAVRRIVQREGIAGLYSGLDSALFGISVTNFVYYYCTAPPSQSPIVVITASQRTNPSFQNPGYEWTRALFSRAALRSGRASQKLTTVESMLAGAIAGSATVLITNPIWVINTRMTAYATDSSLPITTTDSPPKPRKPSTLHTLLSLIRDEGPTALFAGVLPALVLVINPILQYTIFEKLKDILAKKRPVLARDAFFLGALGKLLATGITYPYITIKSRMHVAKRSEQGQQQDSVIQSLRRVVREEGWQGLYKGIGPKITQSVITAAFLLAFKDALYAASVNARRKIPTALPLKR